MIESLLSEIAILREQVQNLEESYKHQGTIITNLLEQQVKANKAKAVADALLQEKLNREKEARDFVNKILAPIGTIVLTIISLLLGHYVPLWLNKP
jgi:hypothetical protein